MQLTRPELDGGLVAGDGVLDQVHLFQRVAQVAVRVGELRTQSNRFLVVGHLFPNDQDGLSSVYPIQCWLSVSNYSSNK